MRWKHLADGAVRASAPRHMLAVHLVTEDGRPLERLAFGNERGGRFQYRPARFQVVAELGDLSHRQAVEWRLSLPANWLALPDRRLSALGTRRVAWLVFPQGWPRCFKYPISVTVFDRGQQVARAQQALGIELHGEGPFDPARDRLPWANRASEFGPVEPEDRHFRATFRLALFPNAFRRNLYRMVVRLSDDASDSPGGVCTGMARVALARSLGALRAEGDALRDAVIVLHGRQLTDRALLAGASWFFWPSPARAYRRFARDLLRRGWSDVCFDVNVPKPWRRDVVRALLGQGHTVVPYAFHQRSADEAEVLVWDPNRPEAAGEMAISFDLQRDRYRYPPLVEDDDRVTIVAVRQRAYLAGGTALLSSAASLVLYSPAARRALVGLAVGVLGGIGLLKLARR